MISQMDHDERHSLEPDATSSDVAASRTPDSPFGAGGSRRRQALRWALYAGILIATIGTVYVATRGTRSPTAGAGHEHTAIAGADAPQPVMLLGDEADRIGVTYASATLGPLSREVRTVGQVTFDETRVRTISPRIEGWIERLHVDVTGQFVRAGAPLFAIYSPMVVATEEELLLARRLERDVESGTDDARASAADLVAAARRRLTNWDVPASEIARIERTGQIQRTVTLVAPVSGFITEKNVLQGQRVMAGDALYRIADLSAVWIEGEVFEQDLPSIRLGQRAAAVLQALPGQEFTGRIAYIYPTLDPDTRTARVRVELANAGYRLKPGMYATLRLSGAVRPSAISVPRSAVLVTGERSLVFVRRADGMLEPREVTTGIATDERIEILRGVAAGETVVTSATFLVDAESNLGTVMGGMGNMPGMDLTAPAKSPPDAKSQAPVAPPAPAPSPDPHSGHRE